MSVKPSGYIVSGAHLTVIATCIGIFVAGWNGVGYFKASEAKDQQQDMRLEQAEKSAAQTDSKLDRLSEKVDQTKEAVIKLTTVIEQNGLSKKASRIPLPDDNILVTPTEFVIQK